MNKPTKNLLLLALLSAMAAPAFAGAGATLPADLPRYGQDKPIPVPQIPKHKLAQGREVGVLPRKGPAAGPGTRPTACRRDRLARPTPSVRWKSPPSSVRDKASTGAAVNIWLVGLSGLRGATRLTGSQRLLR